MTENLKDIVASHESIEVERTEEGYCVTIRDTRTHHSIVAFGASIESALRVLRQYQ